MCVGQAAATMPFTTISSSVGREFVGGAVCTTFALAASILNGM